MERIEIEAESGEEFQEYVYKDGTRVPEGVVIGYEIEDKNGKVKIELKEGIFYP